MPAILRNNYTKNDWLQYDTQDTSLEGVLVHRAQHITVFSGTKAKSFSYLRLSLMLTVTIIVPTFSLFPFQEILNTDGETHTILLYDAPAPKNECQLSECVYTMKKQRSLS